MGSLTRIVGVDLGQARDYTAICGIDVLNGMYKCTLLERPKLGTSYPDIVKIIKPLAVGAKLVVDATGVGRPVVDLMRTIGLKPIAVTITGGDESVRSDHGWRVPKRVLVSGLQVALQTKTLKIVRTLELAETLVRELRAFRVKVSLGGHDSYEALREGDHDDLVLAASLAVWGAKLRDVPRTIPGWVQA